MPDAVTAALLNAGILGPVVIAVGWYTLRLQTQLKDSQEKRVEDAQRVVSQLLELNDRWNQAIGEQMTAFDAQRELIERVHETLRDVRDHLRRGIGST